MFLLNIFVSNSRNSYNRRSHRRCSIEIGVLENFTNFTGKHLCQSLLFSKVRPYACNFIKKETLALAFSCEFCEILRTPFYRTPLDDCFCYNSVQNTLGKSKKSSKVGQEQNIFISTFALFFSTSTKHLFLEGRLPIGQICICGMFAEHSYDIFPEYSEKAPHEIPGSIPK